MDTFILSLGFAIVLGLWAWSRAPQTQGGFINRFTQPHPDRAASVGYFLAAFIALLAVVISLFSPVGLCLIPIANMLIVVISLAEYFEVL